MSEELGVTVKRSEDFSKWYIEVVRKGNFVDQRSPIKGCDVIMPWGYTIWEFLQQRLDGMIKKHGVTNAYFPLFIPESLLKKEEEHFAGFRAETVIATEAGGKKLEERLAIRPTSETIMYYMYKLWIRSYKDLPLKINQWCNVVRWDTKVTKPLLRNREFLWQEGHTAHATKEDAELFLENVVKIYAAVYDALAMEPLILVRPKSDTFAGADYSIVFDTLLQDGKVSQGPGSHLLGQHFSKPLDITFLDKDGKNQHVWQTSWGMTTRQLGILVMHHGDDKGAVIPPHIAPYQAVIVPILFKGKEQEIIEKCQETKKKLEIHNIRVHLDERDYTAGFKFNEWELRGVPLRIEIGPKDMENNEVTAVRRTDGKKYKIKMDRLDDVNGLLEEIQRDMRQKSHDFLKKNITDVTDMKTLKTVFGFGRANWCGASMCEKSIKADSEGYEIRGTAYGKKEEPFAKCLHCKKDAKHVVYIAKAY